MKTISYALLIFATLVATKADAAPNPSCGESLTSDTVLYADMNCTIADGNSALFIGADNIEVDLNGHTINATEDIAGIHIYATKGVVVKNGTISHSWTGIRSSNNEKVSVEGVSFYKTGMGITSFGDRDARIENNQFIKIKSIGIDLRGNADRPSYANLIKGNDFSAVRANILLCGEHTYKNSLINNHINQAEDYGISIRSSHTNRVFGNRIYNSKSRAISLSQSSYNHIEGNSFRVGEFGMTLNGYTGDYCSDNPLNKSIKNKVLGNHFIDFFIGVALGFSVSPSSGAENNQINMNKIYDNNTGILFYETTYQNDATNNAYQGTLVPVNDNGVSNTY